MYNKNALLLLLCTIFLTLNICCKNNGEKKKEAAEEITVAGDLWKFDYDSASNDMVIVSLRPFEKDTLQTKTVIDFLNSQHPDVLVEYIKTSNDTIFVKVNNSNILTQNMGSEGADFYIKSATYLLSDLKDIHYVSFDFPEGDHAIPGVYKKQDWQY